MGDPFRDELIEEIECFVGHRLMQPEEIHTEDLKALRHSIRYLDEERQEANAILEEIETPALTRALERMEEGHDNG